jgi:HSP20 family protein
MVSGLHPFERFSQSTSGSEVVMAEKTTATTTPARSENRLAQREPGAWSPDPFGFLRRFTHELDRVFDDFGLGRGGLFPGFGRGGLASLRSRDREDTSDVWNPDIEVFHRGNELVIRADLPGLNKDDVKVEVTEDAITIQGERRREHEEEREGVYRSELSYGSFFRTIPLPEGAITEQAKATFKNGVLEIVVPAPPEQANRGRRLEITQGAESKK